MFNELIPGVLCALVAIWPCEMYSSPGFPQRLSMLRKARAKNSQSQHLKKHPVVQSFTAQPGAHCYASFSRRMKVERDFFGSKRWNHCQDALQVLAIQT